MANIYIEGGIYSNLNQALPNGRTNIGSKRISDSFNPITDLEDSDIPTKFVNAVEIDWNGAILDESYNSEYLSSYIGHPVNSTGDILNEVSHKINEIEFADILYKYLKSDNIDINLYKDRNESYKKLYIGKWGRFVMCRRLDPRVIGTGYDVFNYVDNIDIIDYEAGYNNERFSTQSITEADENGNRIEVYNEDNEKIIGCYVLVDKKYEIFEINFENDNLTIGHINPNKVLISETFDQNMDLYKITFGCDEGIMGKLKISFKNK